MDSPPAPQALRSVSAGEQRDRRLCGGFQRWAGAPLCVVAEEGVTGEKPHRKGFSLVCPFGDFYDKGKVTRVRAGEARELSNRMAVTGEEKCFSPTRPAMGESKPIGAMRWHRKIKIPLSAEPASKR